MDIEVSIVSSIVTGCVIWYGISLHYRIKELKQNVDDMHKVREGKCPNEKGRDLRAECLNLIDDSNKFWAERLQVLDEKCNKCLAQLEEVECYSRINLSNNGEILNSILNMIDGLKKDDMSTKIRHCDEKRISSYNKLMNAISKIEEKFNNFEEMQKNLNHNLLNLCLENKGDISKLQQSLSECDEKRISSYNELYRGLENTYNELKDLTKKETNDNA